MSESPISLLCIEPRFPGRLGAVADWLVRQRGYRCQFFCAGADSREYWPAAAGRGLDVILFNVGGVAREAAVPWTRALERGSPDFADPGRPHCPAGGALLYHGDVFRPRGRRRWKWTAEER